MSIDPKPQLSASLEDYLEAIYHLSDAETVARSKDIAERLGVSRASVTSALRVLSEKGLVNYKPYGYITLTEKGRKPAVRVAGRHEILRRFFAEVLGVNEQTAHEAACRAEHTMGPEITSRLVSFVDFVTQGQDDADSVVGQFQDYWHSVNKD